MGFFENLNKAETALDIAIENTKIGNYEKALESANEARWLNPELPDIQKLVTVLQVLSADPNITHYELLRVEETANENEIGSAFRKLAVDLNPDTDNIPKASEAYRRISEAMGVLSHDRSKYDNYLAGARALLAECDAMCNESAFISGAPKFVAPECRAWVDVSETSDRMISSMNTESLLEANKDDAIRAQEIAITKANQELYDDALKFARKAQRMNQDLPKIKKLVVSMEILSAPSDTTHYKLLGVEKTVDATKISSAFRKLSIDVHPDQNTFPKASEAFKRIAIAAGVLSDEQSRAMYDNDLAAARKSAHEAARNAAAREAAAREAAAAAAREAAAQEAAAHDVSAREDDASFIYRDPVSGISYFTESFSDDSSSADTSCTDSSSSDDSSTNASSTDDVGPGSKRASDAQATSTLHTPKKRREGHGPLNFN